MPAIDRSRAIVLASTAMFVTVALVSLGTSSSSCGGRSEGFDDAGASSNATKDAPSSSGFTSSGSSNGFNPPKPFDAGPPIERPDANVPFVECALADAAPCEPPPRPHCANEGYLATYGKGPCVNGQCSFTVNLLACMGGGCVTLANDGGALCHQIVGP